MKRILFVSAFTVAVASFTLNVYGYYSSNINYAQYLHNARNEYEEINKVLEKTANDINEKSEAAFKKIEKYNANAKDKNGVFVIDPATGKLLVTPPYDAIGANALENSAINGKALAREAIKEALAKMTQSPWECWADFAGVLYNDYFTRIAITENGKVYVVAIGKSNLNLQHLFVQKIVSNACKMLKEKGLRASLKAFDDKKSMFNFEDTYVFVYQVVSKDKVIGVFNPNYPGDKGKNMLTLKTEYGSPVKEMLKFQKSGSGWIKGIAKVPGNDEMGTKNIYVEFIKLGDKLYIVGSGVYLKK
jgi:hypothetical protein